MNKLSLFGIGIVLARWLGPQAFGTYAVAYVALTALVTFNELGVSLAIVRWEGNPKRIIPTVSSISIFFSVLIYACSIFVAPWFTEAMRAPAATSVVRVLALCILIDGFTNVPVAVLQRNFEQGKRTIADQVNVWLSTGVTLVLAFTGHGAMSLAIGRLIGNFASMILLLIFVPDSLRLGFDRVLAPSLLRFGLPLAGSNLLLFAVTTVDQVVVGHVLGAVALGFYVLASNLSSWPINVFSMPVRNVAPAMFSRLQQDSTRMRRSFLSVAGLLTATALPVCFLIGGTAKPLIGYVYGARWQPAAEALIWLSMLAAARIFFELAYDYLGVLAKSRLLLAVQLVWLAGLVPGIVEGARIAGIYGAGLAAAVVAYALVLPCYIVGLRVTGVGLAALARHLLLPVTGGILTWLASREAARFVPSDFIALALSGVLTLCIIALLGYRMRSVIKELRVTTARPVEESIPDTFRRPSRDDRALSGDLTEDPAKIRGGVESQRIHDTNGRFQNGIAGNVALGRTVYGEITGPIPRYRDDLGERIAEGRREIAPTHHRALSRLQQIHKAASERGPPINLLDHLILGAKV